MTSDFLMLCRMSPSVFPIKNNEDKYITQREHSVEKSLALTVRSKYALVAIAWNSLAEWLSHSSNRGERSLEYCSRHIATHRRDKEAEILVSILLLQDEGIQSIILANLFRNVSGHEIDQYD